MPGTVQQGTMPVKSHACMTLVASCQPGLRANLKAVVQTGAEVRDGQWPDRSRGAGQTMADAVSLRPVSNLPGVQG